MYNYLAGTLSRSERNRVFKMPKPEGGKLKYLLAQSRYWKSKGDQQMARDYYGMALDLIDWINSKDQSARLVYPHQWEKPKGAAPAARKGRGGRKPKKVSGYRW